MATKIEKMSELGTEFWNDSCDPKELSEAIEFGAVGATSNPVIVASVVNSNKEQWVPEIKKLIRDFPNGTEDDLAWKLVELLGINGAKLLEPEFQKSNGSRGFMSMQVNPKFYVSPDMMFEHGLKLAQLAPNIAIKCPTTLEGVEAMKKLTANGVNVNATVSFSVSQALSVAEAIEEGLKICFSNKVQNPEYMHPYVTLMVGRSYDHLCRYKEKNNIDFKNETLMWGAISIFRKSYNIFNQRGYQSRLLQAAYRTELQWKELIGPNTLQTIPYKWWKKYQDSSSELKVSVNDTIDIDLIKKVDSKFPTFGHMYNEGGMETSEFKRFEASIHTLNQFLSGYDDLVQIVRSEMLN